MKYLINKKRFKKKYTQTDYLKINKTISKIFKTPSQDKNYFDFFNNFAKKNYKKIENKCVCKFENDIILAESDRHMIEFQTVICGSCGLIRAKKYFTQENISDFYTNHYRKMYPEDAENLLIKQFNNRKDRYDLIVKYFNKELKNLKITDVGGGIGGVLKNFDNKMNDLYLVDYFEPYLNHAKKNGIKTIKGGLKEINFQPDIVILSHVVEHWSNFEEEIKSLISIQKIGTINYIEFPGVDSLKLGRREANIIGDIHVPHVYYFHSDVFENIMNRNGFEKLYIDTQIRSIFKYTGEKKGLINYFSKVKKDLEIAEKVRNRFIIQNFIKLFLPNFIINLIRSIRKKKIHY